MTMLIGLKSVNLRVGADVADNTQGTVGLGEGLAAHERRNLRGQVDAVDEDIGLVRDCVEGTT